MVDVGACPPKRGCWSSTIRRWCGSITVPTLEKAGFEVEQAINGIEAMERALSQPFDLVIVDVNMPRMDGFSFLRALRRVRGRCRDAAGADDFHRIGNAGCRRRQGGRRQFLSGQAGRGSRTGSTCLRPHGSRIVSALQEQFVTEARELIRQATDDLIVSGARRRFA